MHYNRAIPDPAAGDYVADANLNDVAAAQLAIDRKVERSLVPETPVLVQPKSNGTNLLGLRARFAPRTPPSFQGRRS